MAKINITESELKNIINESVRKILSELDWKTWQNASEKTQNSDRKNAFMAKARDEFNKKYGHETPESGSYTEMGKYGDLQHVNNFVGGGKTYKDLKTVKTDTLGSDTREIDAKDMEYERRKWGDSYDKSHARAIQKAEDEYRAHHGGHYEYKPGEGWKKGENAPKTDWHDYRFN